jgi:hypothetical protein
MRMTAFHLHEKTLGHVVQSKGAALLRHHGVKQDLEQQISQLFAQLHVVAAADGVVDFVCFLDEVGTQRLVRLRRVPLAARAQVAHER